MQTLTSPDLDTPPPATAGALPVMRCPGTLLCAAGDDDNWKCGVTGRAECPADEAEQAKCPIC